MCVLPTLSSCGKAGHREVFPLKVKCEICIVINMFNYSEQWLFYCRVGGGRVVFNTRAIGTL